MLQNNILSFFNRGLKASLFETSIKLQQTDFTGAGEVEKALESIYSLNYLLNTIWVSEQKHIWAYVEKQQPGIVENIRKDKALILGSLLKLEQVIYDSAHSSPDEVSWLTSKVLHSIILYGINFIDKREEVLNNLLKTSGDRETAGFFWHMMLSDLSREEIASLLKWMITGLNLREIIYCLRITGANSSKEYFFWMLQTAQNEMEDNRWQIVQDALAEGTMMG